MKRDGSINFTIVLLGAAFAGAGFVGAHDILLYNPSSSIPTGFYVRTEGAPNLGAIVTVRARDVAEEYARLRNFTDDGDRFIKRVAAEAGDRVCALGNKIAINGDTPISRHAHDSAGRALPRWSGCRTLEAGEFFLLGDTSDSFDSRYWGPVEAQSIGGVWTPLR